MKTQLSALILFICSVVTAISASAVTPQIMGKMNIINNNIIVHIYIENVTEIDTPIQSGIEKEIIFTVELLRVWKYWPDEFVVSKRIAKVVRYDNLREQYSAFSSDGITRSEKYFKNYPSMKHWIFTVEDVNLANIKELDPGHYYIRIVVESKSLQQLPLLGVFMHFMPEIEMSLAKESDPFFIGGNQ